MFEGTIAQKAAGIETVSSNMWKEGATGYESSCSE
jgi:hypothetical protein